MTTEQPRQQQRQQQREADELSKRMERESKLFEDMRRAAGAAAELEFTKTAFEALRQSLITAWQATDPRDEKGREKLWLATTQLTQVEKALRNTVLNGVVAQREINEIRKAGERKRFFSR